MAKKGMEGNISTKHQSNNRISVPEEPQLLPELSSSKQDKSSLAMKKPTQKPSRKAWSSLENDSKGLRKLRKKIIREAASHQRYRIYEWHFYLLRGKHWTSPKTTMVIHTLTSVYYPIRIPKMLSTPKESRSCWVLPVLLPSVHPKSQRSKGDGQKKFISCYKV